MKSPMLAAMLNIIPGFGYVYIGGKRRVFGLLVLVGMILSLIAAFNNSSYQQTIKTLEQANTEGGTAIVLPSSGVLEIVAGLVITAAFMVDAHAAAQEANQARDAKIKALIK